MFKVTLEFFWKIKEDLNIYLTFDDKKKNLKSK